jgi:hypothetical protein
VRHGSISVVIVASAWWRHLGVVQRCPASRRAVLGLGVAPGGGALLCCSLACFAALLATRDGSPEGGDAGRCVGGSVHDSPSAGGGSRQ